MRRKVVDMMTADCDLDKDKRIWRRSLPAARVAILEHRVYLNDRLVTHTEVAVPEDVPYILKVWSHHDEGFDVLRIPAVLSVDGS